MVNDVLYYVCNLCGQNGMGGDRIQPIRNVDNTNSQTSLKRHSNMAAPRTVDIGIEVFSHALQGLICMQSKPKYHDQFANK